MIHQFPEAFSQTFQVRYDECGPGGALRAAVHLRLFQEVAFGHSAAGGFPPSWYEEHRLYWVVRRVNLIMHAPAYHGDLLIYTTRVAGARRVMARRVSTARRERDNGAVATCTTDWIFTQEAAAAARIPEALAAAFPGMTRPVAPSPLDEPPVPPAARPVPLRLRHGDTDSVGHVNNPVYLDLLDDAVIRAGGGAAVSAHSRTYDLQYEAAVCAGDPLQDLAWDDGMWWHYRLERDGHILVLYGRVRGGEFPTDAGTREARTAVPSSTAAAVPKAAPSEATSKTPFPHNGPTARPSPSSDALTP